MVGACLLPCALPKRQRENTATECAPVCDTVEGSIRDFRNMGCVMWLLELLILRH